MPDFYDAHIRHAKHYSNIAYDIGLLFHWWKSDAERVELEWGQLEAAWSWILNEAPSPEIDEFILNNSDVLVYVGRLHDKYRELIPSMERWLEAARRQGRQDQERTALLELGHTSSSLGDARIACDYYQQLLAIDQELNDRIAEGFTTRYLGDAYFDLNDMDTAITLYERQLSIAREIGHRFMEGSATGGLGSSYTYLDQFQLAIEYHEQELAIMRELGDRAGESIALNNLGNAYSALGDVQTAISFFEHVLAIDQELGDPQWEAVALWNLGHELLKRGDVQQGTSLMQVLINRERKIGHLETELDAARLEDIRQQRMRQARRSGGHPEASPEDS